MSVDGYYVRSVGEYAGAIVLKGDGGWFSLQPISFLLLALYYLLSKAIGNSRERRKIDYTEHAITILQKTTPSI